MKDNTPLEQEWPLERIKPYSNNPRVIPATAVEKVAKSLQVYGWRQHITVDPAGVIISGHTRYLAALQLGLDTAPVEVVDDLTPEEIKALRIADNRTAEETDWDYPILARETQDIITLDAEGAVSEALGYDEEERDWLLEGAKIADDAGDAAALDQDQVRVTCPHCGVIMAGASLEELGGVRVPE